MKKETYEKIKKNHGNYASFAIWDKEKGNYDDPIIIGESINKLKTSIIIVGLKPSRKTSRKFEAFHCKHRGGRDMFLREAFNKSPFRGAYMTDIIKTKKKNEEENIKIFLKELKDLKCKNPKIIAMGDDAYKILKKNKNPIKKAGIRLKIKQVPHYSYNSGISKKEFIRKVKKIRKEFWPNLKTN